MVGSAESSSCPTLEQDLGMPLIGRWANDFQPACVHSIHNIKDSGYINKDLKYAEHTHLFYADKVKTTDLPHLEVIKFVTDSNYSISILTISLVHKIVLDPPLISISSTNGSKIKCQGLMNLEIDISTWHSLLKTKLECISYSELEAYLEFCHSTESEDF